MKHFYHLIFVLLVCVLLAACGGQPAAVEKVSPSKLEPIEGSDLSRVILTEKAAERIGVETTSVSGATVPYAAVIYDIEGHTWVYNSPEPLTFVRVPIQIEEINGDTVMLSQGLGSAMNIVTVGVAEIYGAETGVSK